jgi:2-polyprenyl-3-methyl-5-hydroxy-6-metoxy-1,4-benzoquinol methylase
MCVKVIYYSFFFRFLTMNKTDPSEKYRLAQINLQNPKNSHDFQIIFTGFNKKVLEIGTATGYISKILKENNCHVTGIEVNPDWANEAIKYVDRMIIGDIENLDFKKEFNNEKFDVILIGDTLEHLQDPINTLKKFYPLLDDDGYLVCSIPNISYAPIRLHLLNGEFLYDSTGILDRTHFHFFTLDNILMMLDECNFSITKLQRISEIFHIHHRTDLKRTSFHDELITSLLKDPESETFQFVFKAKPNTVVNKSTREYLIQNFPKNYVADELKFQIDNYLRNIGFFKEVIEKIKQSKAWRIYNIFTHKNI